MKKLNMSRLISWHHKHPIQTRLIFILTAFRFILSFAFILTVFLIDEKQWLSLDRSLLFFKIAFSYFIFSTVTVVAGMLKLSDLRISFPFQVTIDLVFIILLMHAVGGVKSSFGLLLIIVIVIGSLVSDGRLALYYAAIATIGILVEHTLQILLLMSPTASYTEPVLLSISCFATAWLAHSLGSRKVTMEHIASARGIDLQNMAQINALISNEIQDGVIVIDDQLRIRHLNGQASQLLAIPAIEVGHFVSLLELPTLMSLYNEWEKQLESSYNLNVNGLSLKIRFLPINPLNDQQTDPSIVGAVIFIQDWSQQQSKSQQAKLAALGRLTANIAHEIRNPLSAISHANQLLQEEIVEGGNVRILEIIEDNIYRIDKIIKDVLELNRRDRTRQDHFELNAFVAEFHQQFCAVESIEPSHFTLTLLDHPQSVLFDQRHLTQILWNLCKNGWEHSKKTVDSLNLDLKNVVVRLVHIVITDDGDGVSEESQAKLFEPFYTTKATGSGLGLYISRELAEANGATLQYQALTQGSAFIMQLPCH
jgi:two-component system, NtrC family, sensor histidine kinase PilS